MEKNKIVAKKVISAICALLLLGYIVYQGYMMVYKPVETEIAYEYTMNQTIDTKIFIIRDEKYLINDAHGTIIPVVEDGKRVAKDQEVAKVFANTTSARNNIQVNKIKQSIDRFTSLSTQAENNTSTDLISVDKDIHQKQNEYIKAIECGEYDKVKTSSDEFRDTIITRQMITGSTIDFHQKIQELNKQLMKLQSGATDYESVKASQSGYYISNVDGFEEKTKYGDVKSLTVNKIDDLIKEKPAKVPSNAIGKLVEKFDWFMVCNVDKSSIGDLNVGDKINVSFPYSSVKETSVQVVSINDTKSDKIAVVLRCNCMDSDLANLRKENAELIINKYKGLKVKPSAIRVNKKGEKGVYVKTGNIIKFKKVDIIYAGKKYVIVDNKEGKSDYIKLYDNVVVEGTELYDRKVIS